MWTMFFFFSPLLYRSFPIFWHNFYIKSKKQKHEKWTQPETPCPHCGFNPSKCVCIFSVFLNFPYFCFIIPYLGLWYFICLESTHINKSAYTAQDPQQLLAVQWLLLLIFPVVFLSRELSTDSRQSSDSYLFLLWTVLRTGTLLEI